MNIAPGIYHYRLPSWERPVTVEVTDTHVRFSRERRPVPLGEVPANAILVRLKLEDVPQVPEQLFVICFDGSPCVAAPILGPTPRTATEILGLYAEQYGMDRKKLSWATVRLIPMPTP